MYRKLLRRGGPFEETARDIITFYRYGYLKNAPVVVFNPSDIDLSLQALFWAYFNIPLSHKDLLEMVENSKPFPDWVILSKEINNIRKQRGDLLCLS